MFSDIMHLGLKTRLCVALRNIIKKQANKKNPQQFLRSVKFKIAQMANLTIDERVTQHAT